MSKQLSITNGLSLHQVLLGSMVQEIQPAMTDLLTLFTVVVSWANHFITLSFICETVYHIITNTKPRCPQIHL